MARRTEEGWSAALRLLDGRRAVPLTLIDAPRGHGRSELLRQVFHSEGSEPGVREILVIAGVGRVSSEEALAAEVVRRLADVAGDQVSGDRVTELGSDHPVDDVDEAIRNALHRASHIVVAVDDAHRAGERALVMLGHLAVMLPPNAHLVVGGAGLHRMQVAELEIDGRLQRIGPDALPMRPLLSFAQRDALFRDAFEKDVDPAGRRLLAVLVALGIRRVDLARIAAQAASLGHTVVDSLPALPGIVLGSLDVEIDDGWQFAADTADPEDLRAAGHAVGRTLLREGRDLGEAVRLAEVVDDAELFRQCVRSALSAQPPRVGAHELRTWSASKLLHADDPHRLWVGAATAVAIGAPLADVFDRYDRTGRAFAAAGDVDAEIAVGMAASIVARRRDDLMAVLGFIARAQELVAQGCDAARAPARFGDALAKQMSGDAHGALAALDQIAPGELSGDWAAQLFLMRGTNLLLLERLDEAVATLTAATGWGSAWSHAVALDLLAFTRWRQGDLVGALDDLQAAERLAGELGQPLAIERARCLRAVMLAASGEPAGVVAPVGVGNNSAEPETSRLVQIANAFSAIAAGDLDEARRIVASVDAPERALRSTSWTAALQVALDPGSRGRWKDVVERHPGLGIAVRSGEAAAEYLTIGRPAPLDARGFVAWSWCEQYRPVVEIDLLGGAEIRRNGVRVYHPSWNHGRVRELCLCLALAPGTARELIAERLWPDHDSVGASRNLRVTLTYLLDVIDPDRSRGRGSDLIVDHGGLLGFTSNDSVRIDLRRQVLDCEALIAANATGDRQAVVSAARRLARYKQGRLLGGASVGAWVEPFESSRRATLLRAFTLGALAAADAADPGLALQLANRGLGEDPWAERLHRLCVEAHLAIDDLDGARRAMQAAIVAIHDIGMAPEFATKRLARSLGMDPLRAPAGEAGVSNQTSR